MRMKILLLCAVLSTGILGCALLRTDIPAMESNVNAHTASINQLRGDVEQLQHKLDTVVTSQQELNQNAQARLGAEMDKLQNRIDEISGNIEEDRHFLTETGARLDRLMALEQRLAALEESSKQVQARLEAAGTGPDQLYEQAVDLVKKGQADAGRTKLVEFIKKYPDSELISNARFWLGETSYDTANFEQAIVEYQEVVEHYPNSDKVPGALLKQAMAFARMGSAENARLVLQKLIDKYPTSSQAEAARKELASAKAAEGKAAPETKKPAKKH
ncbi:MAG: tol-pal system protein YbgF [Pseudomonadota bacterium]